MVAARTQLQEFTVMHRLEVRIPGLNWPRNARRFPIRRLQPERANPRATSRQLDNFRIADHTPATAPHFRRFGPLLVKVASRRDLRSPEGTLNHQG